MKKFIYKILGFSSLFCLALFVIIVLNRSKANFTINGDSQFLLVGHSHSACAFNDSLIDGLTNCSESGESYFYTYFKTKQLINQNPNIDYLFIQFSNSQIDTIMNSWIWGDKYISSRFPKYASFMDASSLKLLLSHNPKSVKESISPWLQFNLNKTVNSFNYADEMGGYLYSPLEIPDSLLKEKRTKKQFDQASYKTSSANIKYLHKIIKYCEQSKVKVFLIRSPLHAKYPGYENEIIFQKLLKRQFSKTEFLDFSMFPASNSEYLDLEHLNSKGANKFSSWFDRLIKNGLLDKKDKQAYIDQELNLKIQK